MTAAERRRLRKHLREHYLFAIQCDHEAKTDVPLCSCSKWPCPPQPSIGEAVERWIDHVLGTWPEPRARRGKMAHPFLKNHR
jgi:hypothetical protein